VKFKGFMLVTLTLLAEPAIAGGPVGAAKLCVARNGLPQAGAGAMYAGNPVGLAQQALGDDGCVAIAESGEKYAWLVDGITTPTKPLKGPLSVCLSYSDAPAINKKVTVIVPTMAEPLVAMTDSSGCAAFDSFSGLYAVLAVGASKNSEPPDFVARVPR
jgi:hypothetical protein